MNLQGGISHTKRVITIKLHYSKEHTYVTKTNESQESTLLKPKLKGEGKPGGLETNIRDDDAVRKRRAKVYQIFFSTFLGNNPDLKADLLHLYVTFCPNISIHCLSAREAQYKTKKMEKPDRKKYTLVQKRKVNYNNGQKK